MQALEELAKTNMDVSDAHAALQDIKGLETDYLVAREGKAAAAVDRVLEESQTLLDETSANYEAVSSLAKDARSVAARVVDLFNAVKGVMIRFDEKSALWEKNMKDREDALAVDKQSFILQRKNLENDRKSLDEMALRLNEAEAKVAADREEVAKMFTLKEIK